MTEEVVYTLQSLVSPAIICAMKADSLTCNRYKGLSVKLPATQLRREERLEASIVTKRQSICEDAADDNGSLTARRRQDQELQTQY